MTADEERQYLCDLIMSASEWRLSEGDERDTIRLEIQDRLRRLNGVDTEDENGYIQSEPVEVSPVLTADDYKAIEAQKLDDYIEKKRTQNRKAKDKWKKDKVRVFIDGKPVWKLISECRKVPRWPDKPGTTGWKWEWVGPGQEVDKLGDELWAQHEAEN